MKKKGTFVSLFMALILFIFSERTVFAAEAINEIVAPTGVKAFLVLIPLVLVLVLLFKKVDMIIAGLIAGILAMIIGGISLAEANSQLLEAIPTMLSITVPIINSAVAMAVFKAGSYTAALNLSQKRDQRKSGICGWFYCHLIGSSDLYVWDRRRECDGDRTVSICGSWGGTRIDRSDVVSGSGLLYDLSCLFGI